MIRATLPGSACAHDWPAGLVPRGCAHVPALRPQVELRRDRMPRRLRPARPEARCADSRRASSRLRSSRSEGEAREAPRLDPRACDPLACVDEVDLIIGEVLGEQFEHPLERGDRRSQLMRGGRDEGAPRVLLDSQPLVHRREGVRELADLIGDRVLRHDDRRQVRLIQPGALRRAAAAGGAGAVTTGRPRGSVRPQGRRARRRRTRCQRRRLRCRRSRRAR